MVAGFSGCGPGTIPSRQNDCSFIIADSGIYLVVSLCEVAVDENSDERFDPPETVDGVEAIEKFEVCVGEVVITSAAARLAKN